MVGGQQAFTSEGQSVGVNNVSESLQGVYRAYFEQHIPVDFVHVRDLGPERLRAYKLLIVPYPVMMSQEHVAALRRYVQDGGTLVTEARCGWVDEKGFSSPVIPGGGLDEVLGCRESELMPIAKPSALTIKTVDEALPLLKPGDKLDTLFFEETFNVFGSRSRVLAEFGDGRPAMVAAPFGQGQAIIVGSFPGSAYHHFHNPNNAKFFVGLAEWLKVRRPVEVSSSEPDVLVEARVLEGDGSRVLFAFNRGEKKTLAKLAFKSPAAKFKLIDLETGQAVSYSFEEDRVAMAKELAPREVWVLALTSVK